MERPARLQIRLIEAGKREVGARRHEQRVQKLRMSIEGRVAGDELDCDLVSAFSQMVRGNNNVIGRGRVRDVRRVGANAGGPLRRAEVQRQWPRGILEREPDRHASGDRALVCRNREMQVVAKIADACCPFFGKRQRDTGPWPLWRLHGGRRGRGYRDNQPRAEATDHAGMISGDLSQPERRQRGDDDEETQADE